MGYIGYDLLGLGHKKFPVKSCIKILPEGSVVGAFDTTFGDVIPNLTLMLHSNRFKAFRIHLWWSDAHKICPIEVVQKRAPIYERIAQDFPFTQIYLSHSCEYNEKSLALVKERIDLIKKLAPNCIPVNAPWLGVSTGNEVLEKHGAGPWPHAECVSTDGSNIYDMDADKWNDLHQITVYRMLWGMRFNLAESLPPGQARIPPKLRTAIPSDEYIRSIVRLAEPPGTVPEHTFSGKVVPIKKPYLYKSHAEDKQGDEDVRANKACLIINSSSTMVEVVTCNGQHVAKMTLGPNGGGFPGGLHRFYSHEYYGYQLGLKAKKLSGSEYVWFKDRGKFWGPVNPAFRQGYFHD